MRFDNSGDSVRKWSTAAHDGATEYVRADLLEAAQADAAAWRYYQDKFLPANSASGISELVVQRDAAQAETRELRTELARVRELYETPAPPRPDVLLPSRGWEAGWYEAMASIKGGLSQPAEQHEWDREGERCTKCGDKDWLAGPTCSGRATPKKAAAPEADLPLMARRPDMPAWAMFAGNRGLWEKITDVRITDTWRFILRKDLEGAPYYRIASHDEHGLPVVERTADMPEWARYRWPAYETQHSDTFAPWMQDSNKVMRIEDYNAHAEPAQREGS